MKLSEHRNYKYTPTDKYNCTFRKATKKEIENGRKKLAKTSTEKFGMRSCYECNQAHGHFMKDFVFRCFECGKIFVDGVDVMDYTQ